MHSFGTSMEKTVNVTVSVNSEISGEGTLNSGTGTVAVS